MATSSKPNALAELARLGAVSPRLLDFVLSRTNGAEFVDHDGLANLLSCSVTTVHKLRKDKVIGEPCQIGGLVRWHWPTVRERILAANSIGDTLAKDEFIGRLNGSP